MEHTSDERAEKLLSYKHHHTHEYDGKGIKNTAMQKEAVHSIVDSLNTISAVLNNINESLQKISSQLEANKE